MIRDRKEEKTNKQTNKQIAHGFQQFSTVTTAPFSFLRFAGLLPKRISKSAEKGQSESSFCSTKISKLWGCIFYLWKIQHVSEVLFGSCRLVGFRYLRQ